MQSRRRAVRIDDTAVYRVVCRAVYRAVAEPLQGRRRVVRGAAVEPFVVVRRDDAGPFVETMQAFIET